MYERSRWEKLRSSVVPNHLIKGQVSKTGKINPLFTSVSHSRLEQFSF